MKISKWSLVGYIFGGLFSLFSAIRYFIVWLDWDKAIVYILIGMIICGLSWLYNTQLNHANTIDAMSDYLADKRK